ncbi:AAA family ATPase [Bacillus sp. SIMBA_074]|uniref:AAA family ATPase n=1 Tax=Bacillus sp. SIMBA_074 TaxID=3085812 RepID=UPI00397BE1D3
MIESVRIRNFKGLENFQLNNVSKINLLGGRNNAGKTTVLEALFMFHDKFNPNVLLRQYNWRGVNELTLNPESLFAPIFYNFDLNKSIVIETTDEKKFNVNMAIKFKNDGSRKIIPMKSQDGQIRTDEQIIAANYLNIRYKGSNMKTEEVNLIVNNEGFGMEVIAAYTEPKSADYLPAKVQPHAHQDAIRFGELDVRGEAEIIVHFLTIIEPRLKGISSITMGNGSSMLHADIGIGKKVPISYMGDGVSRLLTILLAIVTNKNGLVFIDEIENGIHYSVLSKVWEVISKAAIDYNCQLYATTHSYECLSAAINGIRPENQLDFRYFRVERSKKSEQVVSKTFDYETLKVAIEKGWEVR